LNRYELLAELDGMAEETTRSAFIARTAAAEIRRLATAENDLASLLDDYETGQNHVIRIPRPYHNATLIIHD
jgi:hypothetical protein